MSRTIRQLSAACPRSTSRASMQWAVTLRLRNFKRRAPGIPRATLSWNRGQHFFKFGGEFLHVETKINDLNATIGRMNFENRFTNRAVGDLLLGLPSQLALTSFTVMDQGQNMYFSFIQDDFKITPKLTLNLGVRYEFATPPVEKEQPIRQLRSGDGQRRLRQGRQHLRTVVDSSGPQQLCAALRLRLDAEFSAWWSAALTASSTTTLCVRDAKVCSASTRRSWWIICYRRRVTGNAAVASAAPFRLVNGYPAGLLDPASLAPTIGRRAQDAYQRTPYIQQYNFGIQYELMKDLLLDVAYVGNKGTKLNGFRNLNQRAVITNANGSQSAGARPYPAFGDIQWMENRVGSNLQLVAGPAGEALHARTIRARSVTPGAKR